MTRRTITRLAALLATFALLTAMTAGCAPTSGGSSSSGGSSASTSTGGTETSASAPAGPGKQAFGTGAKTAQGYYDIALAAMKKVQPDAVFLIVQTPGVVNSEPADGWSYIFGSKKTGRVYVVNVDNGAASKPQDAGPAGLSAKQWAAVPAVEAWKVDSTTAYAKASAAYQERFSTASPLSYAMGMAAFAPNAPTIKPFVWSVNFDPNGDPAAAKARQIDVDAKTGEVVPPAK